LRTVPEFSALKDQIIRTLVRNKAQELVRRLREKAAIVYLDPGLKPVDAVTPAASRPANPTVAAPKSTSPATAAKVSYWLHDGSIMKLFADGERIIVQFDAPRGGLDDAGIKSGTVLFQGTKRGNTYAGEASTFSPRCGARAFSVTGETSADYKRFSLHGQVMVLDANCNYASTQDETLTFDYVSASGG
jgi:hypothetical protein